MYKTRSILFSIMKWPFLFSIALVGFATALHADSSSLPSTVLTYSNRPLGSPDQPLLMRTFMPDPSLDDTVLANHDKGAKSPKYSAKTGKDVPGEYQPIDGLPAAIGVNYGSVLSYCWDTVECRLLYAWDEGFLVMTPYWGDPKRGNRQSFGYVPKLVGSMFYKAQGKHPLSINGSRLSDGSSPAYRGYKKMGQRVTFMYAVDDAEVHCEIKPGDKKHSVIINYQLKGKGTLDYQSGLPGHVVKKMSDGQLQVTIQGQQIVKYEGVVEKNLLKGGVNAVSGKRVFNAMACGTCHSLDGSKSHGPSLLGLHGKQRQLKGVDKPVVADDAYILESIRTPNAKVVEGYPENYMPPYQLEKEQYQALLLYIKSIKK